MLAYCDGCPDRALASATGWDALPGPPPARSGLAQIGADTSLATATSACRRRFWVSPKLGPPAGSGYRVEPQCNHFADAWVLDPELRARVRAAISQQHLEQKDGASSLTDEDVQGRLDEDLQDGTGSPRVVIDGRSPSAGIRGTAAPYVGRSFQLDLGREDERPVAHGAIERVRVLAPTLAETRARSGPLAKLVVRSFSTVRTTPRRRSGRSAATATTLLAFEPTYFRHQLSASLM
jgi:hypothetical protein